MPYEVGISRYRELARGQIIGDPHGMLKLLVSPSDRRLLGVHVHRDRRDRGRAHRPGGDGQRMAIVDYLVDTVFNYPTLAESYKVAALDALNRLRHLERVTG